MSASIQLAVAAPETRIALSGAIMPLMGGGYVLSRAQGTSTWVLQRHGVDGQPAGGETIIAPAIGQNDSALGIAPLAGGGYAAAWIRLLQYERLGGSLYDVMTQSFSAAGAALGSPLAIGQTIPGRYWISRPPALPQIAALAGGGYVVMWALPSHTDSGVYAQRFNADGTPAAAVHQVTPNGAGRLGATGLTTGAYIVTWGSGGGTRLVRAYSATDAPLGPEMIADRSTAPVNGHSVEAVAGLADGGYVVAWIEAGEVHARRFGADGTPAGVETRIDSVTTSAEPPLAAVALADGGFMIIWSGVGADGLRSNYARRL